ncbi:MAG: DUF3822 family protein [Tannerellaceae bacterium]|nr:DUF3822 family protein [Tannerellaceae bacterium]
MIISLPDKYTVENSEKNILSIRLQPDGLSFSLYDPVVKEDYHYQSIVFDKSQSYITSLKDCFFENRFFTWPFARINIITESPVYVMVPELFFREKQQARFLSYNFSHRIGEPLYNRPDGMDAVLLFQLDKEIYEFCSRSFIHPGYYHHLYPLLPLWSKESSASLQTRMYVNLHPGFIDIVCFRQKELLVVNSYRYFHINDILYYILYVWQHTGLNQLNDRLLLSGLPELQHELIPQLGVYLNDIHPAEIPSEAYLNSGDMLKAPLDLIALTL